MSAGRRRKAERWDPPVPAEGAVEVLAPLVLPMTASTTALLALTATMWDLPHTVD